MCDIMEIDITKFRVYKVNIVSNSTWLLFLLDTTLIYVICEEREDLQFDFLYFFQSQLQSSTLKL